MNSSEKTQFCAICGRNHDPDSPCASAKSLGASGEMGDTKTGEKDKGTSFKNLSRKTDKVMIIVGILLVLLIVIMLTIR